jgi:translocator protein
MNNFSKFLISILGCEAVGFLSTPFTLSSINTWYPALVKPPLTPPDWIFAPVWTALYFFLGVALYLVWSKKVEEGKEIRKALAIKSFLVQLFLNFLWVFVFFYLRLTLLSSIEILLLLGVIVYTMILFWRFSRLSTYLLVLYFLWVAFAAYLNIGILLLNP